MYKFVHILFLTFLLLGLIKKGWWRRNITLDPNLRFPQRLLRHQGESQPLIYLLLAHC